MRVRFIWRGLKGERFPPDTSKKNQSEEIKSGLDPLGEATD